MRRGKRRAGKSERVQLPTGNGKQTKWEKKGKGRGARTSWKRVSERDDREKKGGKEQSEEMRGKPERTME